MRKLAREPLVHFLLLGAALFLVQRLVGGAPTAAERRIVVAPGRIESLAAGFARAWGRPPSRPELEDLVAEHVREEAAVREALALGLDRDDTVVRRRLCQKLELLAEDLARSEEPGDAELAELLAREPASFRIEPRYALRQVFLSPERRGERVRDDALALLAELEAQGPEADVAALGDGLLRPTELELAPSGEIAGLFGAGFAAALEGLPPGRWSGPVESAHGLHLVLVREREAGRPVEELRPELVRAWREARGAELRDAYYRVLVGRYDVIVQWPPAPDDAPAAPGAPGAAAAGAPDREQAR